MPRRTLVLCIFLAVSACRTATSPPTEHSFPGEWPAVLYGLDATQVSAMTFLAGNVLVAGRSRAGMRIAEHEVSSVPGPFLVSLGEVGLPEWAQTLETTGYAQIEAVAVASGPAVIFVGSFEGTIVSGESKITSRGRDCMIGRTDLEGQLQWLRTLGGDGDETCRSLALGTDGSLWLTGSYTQAFAPLPEPVGSSDVMVLRVDAAKGEILSGIGFGSRADDHGHHLHMTAGQELLVVGNFGGNDAGADESHADEAPTLELSSTVQLRSVGGHDGFVVLFDGEGTPQWATAVSGPGFDVVGQVVAHLDGWLVCGAQQRGVAAPEDAASDQPERHGELQGFVARLDHDGGLTWTWSDPLIASVNEVAVVRDRILALGQHRDGFEIGGGRWRVVGETGITLVLLDDEGHVVGGYGCDSPGDDRGAALATSPDGRIALGGNTTPGGGCAQLPGPTPAGFVRLMVLDAAGELRPIVVQP